MKIIALLLTGLMAASAAMAESDLVFSGAVPAAMKEQMQADLRLLQEMQGQDATPIFRQIFSGNFSGSTVSAFFKERIKAVNIDDCDSPLMAACVIHSLSRSTIFLTENYSKFDMPQVYRASILLHESRHTEHESGFWMHEKCPRPFRDWQGKSVVSLISHAPLDGQPACDRTAYGAYGVQAEFLKNTELYCLNCNEKVKLDARIFGTDSVRRITNPEASAEIAAISRFNGAGGPTARSPVIGRFNSTDSKCKMVQASYAPFLFCYYRKRSSPALSIVFRSRAFDRGFLRLGRVDLRPLTELPQLEDLSIWDESMGFRVKVKIGAAPLAGLKAIKRLNLRAIRMDRVRNLQAVAGLTTLEELDIGFQALKDSGILAKLTTLAGLDPLQLEDLTVYYNEISSLEPIAQMTALKRLAINAKPIHSVAPLAGLLNLESLFALGLPACDFGTITHLKAPHRNSQGKIIQTMIMDDTAINWR